MLITFIGMPGSGKSCMSRNLGKKLKRKVVDGDRLIEQKTGRKLQDIIDVDGTGAFMEIERKVLLSINDENLIVSPGGSAVYYDDVMSHFRELGIVVYLYVSYETMELRLGDYSKRGVVLKPGTTLHDLYDERIPLLEKYADITIDCDGNNFGKYHAQTLKKVTAELLKRSRSNL